MNTLEFYDFKLNFFLKEHEEEFKDIFYSIMTLILLKNFPHWTSKGVINGLSGYIVFECGFSFALIIDYKFVLKGFELHDHKNRTMTNYSIYQYNNLYNDFISLSS